MLKAASYEITLRKKTDAPLSLTPTKLRVTFRQGKVEKTANAALYRYARKHPQIFDIKIVLTDGSKMSAERYEELKRKAREKKSKKASSKPEPELEFDEDDEDDDDDSEDLTELSAEEEWIAIMADASSSGPKNDVIEEFAERRKIDLDGKTRKADMIEIIEAAL
jgi:hypothetical protein